MKIVKYGNRKLYNTETSQYVTLGELLKLPLGSFTVVTHGTNENITTETLFAALGSGTVENETKIKVMQHLQQELSVNVVTQ